MKREELLHFIWQYKLLKPGKLVTTKGNFIKILHPGELNKHAGPDFFNARIEMGGLTLVGNVEIHVNSSDWQKHGHQNDPAYNNLILHAVYEHDKTVLQNDDHNVEVLELKDHIDAEVLERYKNLENSKEALACAGQITSVPDLKLSSWLQRMLVERLEKKTAYIKNCFESNFRDYTQTFYWVLARNFGFKINAEPFELLAKNLPIHVLLKHQENLFQLEALLFGTAGFLDEPLKDEYPRALQNEYEFLRVKYKLIPLQKELWKFLRLRPANFPTVRLWQFAMLIHRSPALFTDPIRFNKVEELTKAISYPPGEYWSVHYKPDDTNIKAAGPLGEVSVQNILINTLAPFLFFYGRQNAKDNYVEAALSAFESIPFEDNSKTRIFLENGLTFKFAGESQALINLYDNYCVARRCLNCAVAAELLAKKDIFPGPEF
jgi:hypothetical protein